MKIELRGRCPKCEIIRTVTGFDNPQVTSDYLDRVEASADRRGMFDCHCPVCNCVELVALWGDDKQWEPWMNAVEYEKKNGPSAGPLPPKPW